MARSLSNVKVLSFSFVDGLSLKFNRRGYAGATASVGKGESTTPVVGKVEETVEIKEDANKTCSWGPDPVTGYYKPTDHADEIGTAELRDMALNHKIKPPH
ncbi:unnamed protein product [Ilex paraguariensis]|uniref:Uncharacterized protein n=1 Tax=Ilex paraguariensis TaxID=185542 RepID=A0ABC8R1U9_9AQUA